ncbi:MAG: ferric reductase-like transmembrane domain-containing protein [Chloroflexi bacterium]|nr:ferric reductase-like transmembrane domain-containing protein [Chloroflexota bacterium]
MDKSGWRRLIYAFLTLWVGFVLYTLFRNPAPALSMAVRATALFGYTAVFLTILSTEYPREMRKLFGKPFLTVHHILAVTGLILMILHAVLFALLTQDVRVFLPRFDSLRLFLALGGRPALYLFALAALAAVVRGRIRNVWRVIHWLNYLAFALAFVHSWLIGTDVSNPLLRSVWVVLTGIVLLVFIWKRLLRRRARR